MHRWGIGWVKVVGLSGIQMTASFGSKEFDLSGLAMFDDILPNAFHQLKDLLQLPAALLFTRFPNPVAG